MISPQCAIVAIALEKYFLHTLSEKSGSQLQQGVFFTEMLESNRKIIGKWVRSNSESGRKKQRQKSEKSAK